MACPRSILACLFPGAPNQHLDCCSVIQELASETQAQHQQGAHQQVKILTDPSFSELQQQVQELKPDLIYVAGRASFEQDIQVGTVGLPTFKDGEQPVETLVAACAGAQAVYLDATAKDGIGAKFKAAGVNHVISWPEDKPIKGIVAAQFSHTFFSAILQLHASVQEAFAFASHVVQAHCIDSAKPTSDQTQPTLPVLLSPSKALLPDSSSISPPNIPGIDPAAGLASVVPGWSDIRLLAPRAELRLLLAGKACLIDGTRLSFLGEALRALLVLEMRNLKLVSTTPCAKTPANLPSGCTALRCQVRTYSGAEVVAILGGQPSVLADETLVEHALRMTLVADSLSLQFRLPPPSVSTPQAKQSAAIAGGALVVDALVLTSVWAVHVLRLLSLLPKYKPLISLGIAAVGGTATVGVSALDAQRLKIIQSGQGPITNASAPVAHTLSPQGQQTAGQPLTALDQSKEQKQGQEKDPAQ